MTHADLDQVLRIEADSFATPWRRHHFTYELADPARSRCFVIRREGRVVGYSCCGVVIDEWRINNFAVEASQRGIGLGRRMLDQLLELARRERCVTATLEVRCSNQVAIGLYKSAGFVEVGRRPGYYQREREDALLMLKKLDDADLPADADAP